MADAYILKSKFPSGVRPNTDVYALLQTGFRKNPSGVALVNSHNGETYTYAEFEEKYERAAYHMAENGVGPGDIVCFYGQNCLEYVTMMLATWRLGGIFCAITKLLTGFEVQQLVNIVEPAYFYTDSSCIDKLSQVIKETKTLKKVFCREEHYGCISYANLVRPIPSGKRAPAKPNINTDDAVCLLFSSGTTGLPKAVEISHKNLIFSIVTVTDPHIDLICESQILLVPMSHIYGMMLNLAAVYSGSINIIMDQFDLETYLQLVCKYKVKELHLVPPLVVLMAKHPIVSKYDLSHVEGVFCGAAPLGEEAVAEFKQRMGENIYFRQGYGMTESTAVIAFTPAKNKGISTSLKSVGFPAQDVHLKITDPSTGENLGPDRTGEICFRGPNIMTGYLKNKAATANAIDASGWFHTGDLGYHNKEGHLFVVDRLKELIKYKGYQVPPAELEDLLLSHPQVADCAVIGIPNPEAGELPHAWIVKKPGRNLTEKDIIIFVAEKLAPFKHLRGGVTFVDQIPKSASGKILRKDIRSAMNQPKGKL